MVELLIDDHAAVNAAVRGAASDIAGLIEAVVPRMRRGGRLIYLGAGTSGRLGVLDAAECPPTFQSPPEQVIGLIAGGDAALRRSSEAREDDPDGAADELRSIAVGSEDSVLGIAAGGTTPYVLGGLTIAARAGATTGLLTCATGTRSPSGCEHLIVLETGPELLTGSTRLKAGSATKLALNIISTSIFVRLGKVYSNLMVDLRATNAKLDDRVLRILMELCPGRTREEAAEIVEAAGGELKTAIAMTRLGVDRREADALLEQHDGSLRAALQGLAPTSSTR